MCITVRNVPYLIQCVAPIATSFEAHRALQPLVNLLAPSLELGLTALCAHISILCFKSNNYLVSRHEEGCTSLGSSIRFRAPRSRGLITSLALLCPVAWRLSQQIEHQKIDIIYVIKFRSVSRRLFLTTGRSASTKPNANLLEILLCRSMAVSALP